MPESRKVCVKCGGTGDIRGLGYIHTRCDNCTGGFVYVSETRPSPGANPPPKIDKRSTTYKNAIKELMELGLSKKDAEEKFKEGL